MRSAARAIGWELLRRHRWGFAGVAAYVVIVAAIRVVVLEPGERVNFETDIGFALAIIIPLSSIFMYFLAVFSFGLAGDIAARESVYPSRMFTLPVSNAALAGWPMLYGTVAVAALWMVTRFAGVWPPGDIPILWPALLGAVLLAWTQVFTWMPYGLPGLRIVLTILWLTAIDAVIMVALELRASEGVMLAFLAPQIPLAVLASRHAVARGRRGDTPDWRGLLELRRGTHSTGRRSLPFPSAAKAQEWFEWRMYGRSLPLLVAILVPFELSLLFLFYETPVLVFELILAALVTPPFMASFVAATVAKPSGQGDPHGLPPFMATRPLSNGDLIRAKLTVSLRSAILSWIFVLLAIPAAVALSGASPMVLEWLNDLVDIAGVPRAVVLVLLVLLVFIVGTWKQLVQSLYVGMSGREWAVKGLVFGNLILLTFLAPLLDRIIRDPRAAGMFLHLLPTILVVLVTLKLGAGMWVAFRLRESGLASDRALIGRAVGWDVAVFAVLIVLRWLTPEILFRTYHLALVAILSVPLARLAAAPLAVAGNRHR